MRGIAEYVRKVSKIIYYTKGNGYLISNIPLL